MKITKKPAVITFDDGSLREAVAQAQGASVVEVLGGMVDIVANRRIMVSIDGEPLELTMQFIVAENCGISQVILTSWMSNEEGIGVVIEDTANGLCVQQVEYHLSRTSEDEFPTLAHFL